MKTLISMLVILSTSLVFTLKDAQASDIYCSGVKNINSEIRRGILQIENAKWAEEIYRVELEEQLTKGTVSRIETAIDSVAAVFMGAHLFFSESATVLGNTMGAGGVGYLLATIFAPTSASSIDEVKEDAHVFMEKVKQSPTGLRSFDEIREILAMKKTKTYSDMENYSRFKNGFNVEAIRLAKELYIISRVETLILGEKLKLLNLCAK